MKATHRMQARQTKINPETIKPQPNPENAMVSIGF